MAIAIMEAGADAFENWKVLIQFGLVALLFFFVKREVVIKEDGIRIKQLIFDLPYYTKFIPNDRIIELSFDKTQSNSTTVVNGSVYAHSSSSTDIWAYVANPKSHWPDYIQICETKKLNNPVKTLEEIGSILKKPVHNLVGP